METFKIAIILALILLVVNKCGDSQASIKKPTFTIVRPTQSAVRFFCGNTPNVKVIRVIGNLVHCESLL